MDFSCILSNYLTFSSSVQSAFWCTIELHIELLWAVHISFNFHRVKSICDSWIEEHFKCNDNSVPGVSVRGEQSTRGMQHRHCLPGYLCVSDGSVWADQPMGKCRYFPLGRDTRGLYQPAAEFSDGQDFSLQQKPWILSVREKTFSCLLWASCWQKC